MLAVLETSWESDEYFIARAVVDRVHTRCLGGAISAHRHLLAFQ